MGSGVGSTRPANWYDGYWLRDYRKARRFLAESYPEKLPAFEAAIAALKTPNDFVPLLVDDLFAPATLSAIREEVAGYSLRDTEQHELRQFGRFVVHDNEFFNLIQSGLEGRVGELVGEPVESRYNFLSLYLGTGRCPLHMDAPSAKWTVDLCIDQSRPWPIHISEVVPWPAEVDAATDIEASYSSYEMQPGQTLIFGGSSQWHYRDKMPDATFDDYCTLLFFHFVPEGAKDLTEPSRWAALFDVPEFDELIGANRA